MLFPVVYYLVGYRKKIVIENMRNAFPEKSAKEIELLAKKFYRHFTDIVFEILKMRTISPKKLKKRINYSNPELLEKYYSQHKGVIGMSAHFNNWEWTSGCAEWAPHHPVVIYKPLANKYFDRFMKISRERHGVEMVPMRETLRKVIQDQKEGNRVLYGLISDQSPIWEEVQYWSPLMNQDTAFLTGAEKLAVKTGHPAVYFSMRKIKRGRYIIDMIPLSEDPAKTAKYEITEKFVRTMESAILKNPEFWLWTHRRWKLTSRKLTEMETTKVDTSESG
jgi:KDO2-lipid IV(A) lauroyltransferase